MNPRLLELYNQELHHVRESAASEKNRGSNSGTTFMTDGSAVSSNSF